MRSLVLFDHKAFREFPADWFRREDWESYEAWWLLVDGRKIGCCAFEAGVDFDAVENVAREGSLYIATTGILPAFRGRGFGTLLKQWQVLYARERGFTRMVTNTRESNNAMIRLNEKFGFRAVGRVPGYYAEPEEATVVMALPL